ncbi:uncharacterized protein LOC132054218 [Lycium ferocissimum]|uniref:uncharacterized protein LOC132054218 n=1 Tax=Lycium ferocissimum TaxID=112874 RepID=UPI0028161A45|nr:uncharacterized protein LOC132054218 [Lycium ferocissimum]
MWSLTYQRMHLRKERRFSRMYVCFDALKKGFKSGLRPFIGLDGTFLKGKVKGQLLVAAALDTSKHFYPIAWAVVDKETKVTWSWFLTLLERSLDLKKGEGITFMSDMQKGLIGALLNILPEAHHRYCVRHIEANWCKNWGAGELKKHLWWCSWCTYQEEFQDHLTMMGEENKEAGEDLLNRYPAESWCRAYFDTVCKNWQVENNLVESFNKWVLDARFKPIIKMLEDIRVKVMTMLGEHESDVMNWTGEFSPQTMLLYNQFLKIAQKCTVYFNGDDGYEVAHGVDRHRVNIELKRCTCRTWDLTDPMPSCTSGLYAGKINPLTRIPVVAKGKQSNGGRKTKKRTRSLIDEDDEGLARSPLFMWLTLEEELELTRLHYSNKSSKRRNKDFQVEQEEYK